jgi:tRNA-Thr(GGU) m(6)t(6)A37 methyltransferase TsaA
MTIVLEPIGVVRGGRSAPEDDAWGDVASTILVDGSRFGPEALAGLDSFSHLEIVFHFHRVPESDVETGARHPRGRSEWPRVGIFAQRAKGRPNRLGVSLCRLERVDGLTLHVRGLDALEGTPVLDIKPYLSGFAPRGDVHEPPWAREIMEGYWRA